MRNIERHVVFKTLFVPWSVQAALPWASRQSWPQASGPGRSIGAGGFDEHRLGDFRCTGPAL